PVLAEERGPVEPLAKRRAGFAIALLPLTLADRAFFPHQPQPLEITDNLLLAAGNVPLRIRIVDPQQHPVPEAAVGNGAERVPDVKRAGGAGSEADAGDGERLHTYRAIQFQLSEYPMIPLPHS